MYHSLEDMPNELQELIEYHRFKKQIEHELVELIEKYTTPGILYLNHWKLEIQLRQHTEEIIK